MASRPRHRRVQRPAERAVELEVLFGLVGFRVRVRIGNLGLGSWSQVGAVSLKAYRIAEVGRDRGKVRARRQSSQKKTKAEDSRRLPFVYGA